ncbi:MAG: hypothetical protein ACOYO1_07815 [Bacteroidales bacterium]
MKVFSKKSIISILIILLISVNLHSFACGYYPYENEFRICSFDANFFNFKELNAFSLQSDYLNGDISTEQYNWKQNIDQWYQYCNSKKIKKDDIYNALYSHQTLDVKVNTFIKYIRENRKEAYKYLKELLYLEPDAHKFKSDKRQVFREKWDAFSKNDNYYYGYNSSASVSIELELTEVLGNIKNCKDKFILKRWAYQAVVAAYYQSKPLIVKELFEKYFSRINRSWIDNSAQHYYALVSENKNELMLECVIHGFDKLARNIELLTYTKDFDDKFAGKLNDTTRSYYYFVKCVREYGRGLPYLKKIYQLNPTNKYLDFLLNREINKIENCLLRPVIVSNNEYFLFQKDDAETALNNYKNDLAYTAEFLAFVKKIKKKSLFHDIVVTYTEYLLKKNTHSFNPEKYKHIPNQYLQARIIDFLINFEEKSASGQYKDDLVYIFKNAELIDKDESYSSMYWDDSWQHNKVYMRQQLGRNLGFFMTRYAKHRSEGFLLTAKSQFPQNEWYPFYGQSIYINLYEKASIDDCTKILSILEQRSNDKYIKFLQSDEINHEKIHYCNDFTVSPEGSYDTIKILDIIAQKYVCQEKFNQAIAVYKRFPKQYWHKTCQEMPFVLNMYNATNPFGNYNISFFNKLTFLQQLVDYLRILQKNPNNPLINFYVANAYYSMSQAGCFWYIACPYNSCESFDEARESKFFNKSALHFEKVIKYSRDEKITSASLMALNWMGQLNQKELNKSKFGLYRNVISNCDLYTDYLQALSSSFQSTIHIKPTKALLIKFRNSKWADNN